MRRGRVWFLALAPLSLPPLIFAWAHFAAVATIDRLDVEMNEVIARRRAEGYPRPPLFDDPLPEDAVHAYRRAWTRARTLCRKKSVEITPEETRSAARLCAEDVALALRAGTFHRDRDFESGMVRLHDDALVEMWLLLV